MSASIELAIRELQPGRFAELLVATRSPHGGWMNSVPLPLSVWHGLLEQMDRHLAAGESYRPGWEITGESLLLEAESDGEENASLRIFSLDAHDGQAAVAAEIRLRRESLREALRQLRHVAGGSGTYLQLHDGWEPGEAEPQPRLVVSASRDEDSFLMWEGSEVIARQSLPENTTISLTAWKTVLEAGLRSFMQSPDRPLEQWTIVIEKEVAPGLMCTVSYGAFPSAHYRSGPLHELAFQTQPTRDLCFLIMEEEPDGELYWDWIAQYRCREVDFQRSLEAFAQGRIELYSS